MPDSRPIAPDLIAVVQELLDKEIAPRVPALQQYQLKIVAKLLDTVRRELEAGPAANDREVLRLRALLKRDGAMNDLNAELARRIREGEVAVDDTALLGHLRQSIEDSLRINNPKWLNP